MNIAAKTYLPQRARRDTAGGSRTMLGLHATVSGQRNLEDFMRTVISLVFTLAFFALVAESRGQSSSAPTHAPLRVGIVGLVHGHVHGFLEQSLHSPEIEIVGITDPDRQLVSQAATRYGFDRALLFSDLEEMIQK